MSLLIKCKTSRALVICGLRDPKGIFRIPISSNELPGIEFSVNHSLPINPQILENLAAETKAEGRLFDIEQSLTLTMYLNNGEECTAYIANYFGPESVKHTEFPKIIDVLRAFPANKNRKEFMKAFQYFSVGLKDDIQALTPEDLN